MVESDPTNTTPTDEERSAIRKEQAYARSIDRVALVRNAKHGCSLGRIVEEYEYQKKLLEDAFSRAKSIIANRDICSHLYGEATFTVRRNVLGKYNNHYEHTCTLCSFIETYVDSKVGEPPAWTTNATERYYNNHLFG